MPNPRDPRHAQLHLRRDSQQWIFDYVIQQSGRVYHWWTGEGPTLPETVRSHAMVSKHLGLRGIAKQEDGDAALAAGNRDGALEQYWGATRDLIKAQHHIFELNDEKQFLYTRMRECYERVRDLCPYRIERVEIPWEGTVVAGRLHLCPGVERAPLLFYMPGCDTTCESSPNPMKNPNHERGLHVFSFDGPGLGQSNMRGIKLTADNFEQAASAALDVLVQRPEIDENAVVSYGGGMGSFWAMRFAAHDQRVAAVATKSSYSDKYWIMNEDSPRYKRLLAFLTQADSEDELDDIGAAMQMDGYMERIQCPTLMLTGEYDHRDPVEEVLRLFDQLRAPGELWAFADQFHQLRFAGGQEVYDEMIDWLCDRIAGTPVERPGAVRYIQPDSAGPNSPSVEFKRRWFEGL